MTSFEKMAGPILVKDEEKVMQLFRQLFGKWARNSRCYFHLTESSEDAAMERPSVSNHCKTLPASRDARKLQGDRRRQRMR